MLLFDWQDNWRSRAWGEKGENDMRGKSHRLDLNLGCQLQETSICTTGERSYNFAIRPQMGSVSIVWPNICASEALWLPLKYHIWSLIIFKSKICPSLHYQQGYLNLERLSSLILTSMSKNHNHWRIRCFFSCFKIDILV